MNQATDAAALATAAAAPRLLVVDDNAADRELVTRELLRQFPHVRIRTVQSRLELDAALAADDYDLAITDYRLMFSTGIEVLRAIKARDPLRPVIMFTASGSEEIAASALHEGLDDYITKTPKHYARIPLAVSAALARAAQREQLERQSALIHLTSDAIIVRGRADGRVRFWNRGAERLYGWRAEEALGQVAADLLHTRLPVPLEEIDRALDTDGAWSGEVEHRTRDGGTVVVLARWQLHHADGDAEVLQTGTDITRRKAVEDDIRRERQQLQALFDVLPVGIAIAHDPRGDHITLQPRFEQWIGLPHARNASLSGPQADALPYRCMRDGRDIPAGELPMQQAARTGRDVRDAEFDMVRADGEVLHMLMSASPLFDDKGAVRGAVGAAMDVTALKRVQRSLERASRQKDEFVAMLAHELRNPLAPIRNACELLARMTAANPEAQRIADMIRRQVVHLVRLVDDLLDVSRIERGRIQLKQETVALADVVAHALETVEPLLREKNHEVSLVSSYGPLHVRGDPARLVQCFANVLANAAKYTDPGGRIVVTTHAQGELAVVEITDNGTGIAPELLPHIFDLFVQSERTLDRSQGGLGIGLTLVRRLIEMHGGAVAAHSAGTGQGATIEIRLPLVAAVPAPAATAAPGTHRVCRVLIVDDNVDAALSLAMVLGLDGHDAVPVYNGRSALAHVAEHPVDVVLLDIGLPEMDGYEVARRLRALPQGANLQVIALTGYGQADDRARALEAGFDDHMVKPVDLALLRERLCAPAAARA